MSFPAVRGLWHRVGSCLFVLYLILLLFIVLWPSHVDDNASGELVRYLLTLGQHRGVLPGWFGYAQLEWLANVLMFVPGGFLLTLLVGPARRLRIPLFLALASITIELLQLFLPERTSSIFDVLANTLGGLVGCFVGIAVLSVNSVAISRNNGQK
ncbi:MAG: VanZ family protein [Rothia sp. (in: high G+C Gram-positive bacteria)]|nr:VanZ family protein [Rothia sp. (in: high G+C Gram-positive bacteria)]